MPKLDRIPFNHPIILAGIRQLMANASGLDPKDPDFSKKYAVFQEKEQKQIDEKEPTYCLCCGQEIK